jgi:hypothetical protein
MPPLADRDQHEEAITADLVALFAAQQAEVERANSGFGQPRWDQFRVNLQQAIQRRFQPIVLAAGAAMPRSSTSPELLLFGSSRQSGSRSPK